MHHLTVHSVHLQGFIWGGGHLPPSLDIRIATFFQGIIGCNEYRTETQQKQYTA